MLQIVKGSLRCNYAINACGLTDAPILRWELASDKQNQFQKAYRVIVAYSLSDLAAKTHLVWDSGYVVSENSSQVEYSGKILQSSRKYYWQVSVWDETNQQSSWSESAFWITGIVKQSEWCAKWITGTPYNVGLLGDNHTSGAPAPLLRKNIQIIKKVQSAFIHICGLGYYELYISGIHIGDSVLDPAVSRYDHSVVYQSYDVKQILSIGEQSIGCILGNGWYNCFTNDAWSFAYAPWRDHPKLLFQLIITYIDNEQQIIVSDPSWKTLASPIIFDGLRNGEIYDARNEIKDWNLPYFDDSMWNDVSLTHPPGGTLIPQQFPPIRKIKLVEAIKLHRLAQDVWVFDFGQNLSGWAHLCGYAPTGTKVKLRYLEKVGNTQTHNQTNIDSYILSGEFQTDYYIFKGDEVETWEPRFTYHGFRYIELSGYPSIPTLKTISAVVVHTDLESTGEFSCENDLLNKIQVATQWTTLTNYHGIPTDCPHREKNGWTGDAQLSCEQVLFNYQPVMAYRHFLAILRDCQRMSGQLPCIAPTGGWGYNWGSGPAWDSAIFIIPWFTYIYYGDITILRENYQAMKKYWHYMNSFVIDHTIEFGLGDWCSPYQDEKTSTRLTDTAYYYIDTILLSRIALILGYEKDAHYYRLKAGEIKSNFLDKFSNILDTAEQVTQTSLACVLYFGLADKKSSLYEEKLVNLIAQKNYHLHCGILGAKYVLQVLNLYDHNDVAYKIATQTDFPSWGYCIMQGATTLWENWDGSGSQNHHMFSDISAWFYKAILGINPDPASPGFKHFFIKPTFIKELQWATGKHTTPYGDIRVKWNKTKTDISLEMTIPVNTSATIYLPNRPALKLGSGTYTLSCAVEKSY